MTLSLHFGALCKSICEQLNEQGFELSELDGKRFQDIADSIIMLKLHGILPDSTVLKSEQKLMKMICSAKSLQARASPAVDVTSTKQKLSESKTEAGLI